MTFGKSYNVYFQAKLPIPDWGIFEGGKDYVRSDASN